MARDIYNSAKGFFTKVKMYAVDVTNKRVETLMLENKPIIFNARKHDNQIYIKNIFDGAFQFNSSTLVISTTDKLINIKNNNLVIYKGKRYIVTQFVEIDQNQRNEFSNKSTKETFISLRGY